MAVEIKELVVNINLSEKFDNNNSYSKNVTSQLNPLNQKDIVNECVEKVLEKLDKQADR